MSKRRDLINYYNQSKSEFIAHRKVDSKGNIKPAVTFTHNDPLVKPIRNVQDIIKPVDVSDIMNAVSFEDMTDETIEQIIDRVNKKVEEKEKMENNKESINVEAVVEETTSTEESNKFENNKTEKDVETMKEKTNVFKSMKNFFNNKFNKYQIVDLEEETLVTPEEVAAIAEVMEQVVELVEQKVSAEEIKEVVTNKEIKAVAKVVRISKAVAKNVKLQFIIQSKMSKVYFISFKVDCRGIKRNVKRMLGLLFAKKNSSDHSDNVQAADPSVA